MELRLLKDYPIEIQKVAYQHHVKEEGADAWTFEEAQKFELSYLFMFKDCPEGFIFWDKIHFEGNIEHFYTIYPK